MPDSLIKVLVVVTLIQLMVTIGLGVTIREIVAVATNWRLTALAAIANYLVVPLGAVVLLRIFHPGALVAAGFLITAVCPGAPYAPPFTGVAKGNVPVAIGLMALLAGSSAIVSPFLLNITLPLVAGDAALTINALKMDETLFITQLLPLAVGVVVRTWRPKLAERVIGPSKRLSLFLNIGVVGLIVASRFALLLETRPFVFAGILALVLVSVGAGWLLGVGGARNRIAMAFSTGARNFGAGLAIAATSFPQTQAVEVTLVYGLLQTIALAFLAVRWGRRGTRSNHAAIVN